LGNPVVISIFPVYVYWVITRMFTHSCAFKGAVFHRRNPLRPTP